MTATMPTDALAEAIGVLVAERLRPEVQALVQSLIIPVKDDVLAGAEQIASHMGVQERFVRDHEDDLPVRRVGSKLFASRSAVTDWLRCRQDDDSQPPRGP